MKIIDTRQQPPRNLCRGLHAEIRGLNDIIVEKNHEIGRHRSTIKHLETNVRLKDREISQRRVMSDELEQDRDWWRTSALDTEKTRARLNNELGECQNTIDGLKAQIKEHNYSEGMIVGNLRNINVLLHKTIDERDDTICEMVNEIDEKDATIDKLNTMYYDSLDELMRHDDAIDDFRGYRNKLERVIKSMTGVAVDYRMKIDELEGKLADMEQHANETHELLQDMSSHNWKQTNEIAGMKTVHWSERRTDRQTIKELEAKLADRERRFNELDAILVRTRESFLNAKDYVHLYKDEITKLKDKVSGLLWQRIQDSEQSRTLRDTIDKLKGGAWMLHNENDRIDAMQYGSIVGLFNRVKELEAELSARKEASEIVDKWYFQVGDKVVSTDHAKRTESIYIEGHVVRVYGDILFVDVGGHIESVSFTWMKKV